jgi:BTB/POZ domain-containing protein KCTD9
MNRRTIAETWSVLQERGEQPPKRKDGTPFIPHRQPAVGDEELGFEFFRTLCEGDYSALSIPRTFFGRSRIAQASFENSDLFESVLCWNDFVDVNFSRASLQNADLRRSVFERCLFASADLRGADLRGSAFTDCGFSGALLEGAVVERGADWLTALEPAALAQLQQVDDEGDDPAGG